MENSSSHASKTRQFGKGGPMPQSESFFTTERRTGYYIKTHDKRKMLSLMAALNFQEPEKHLKYGEDFSGYYLSIRQHTFPFVQRIIDALDKKPRRLRKI